MKKLWQNYYLLTFTDAIYDRAYIGYLRTNLSTLYIFKDKNNYLFKI